ncbi:MAG TPA: CopD family protein [Candidatus Binatia bacterium]|nr:CopD family protein [Candidatus Binatia bacterium]
MVVLGDFLDDLIGGCGVVAWSLVVGGVVWALAVLGAWRPLPTPAREALARCLRLVGAGAAGVVVAGSAQVTIKARLLAAALGRSAFPEFASTPFFLAHLVQAMVAVAVLAADVLVRRRPGSRARWAALALATAALVANTAWLVHGASRLEHRGALMTVTALHALGAGAWGGGLAQLVALWRLARRRPDVAALWPVVLRRFSFVALPATALVAGTGAALGWVYVRTWNGLAGTPYGALVVTKAVLFACALALGALNFLVARRAVRGVAGPELRTRAPYHVETEALALLALLLAAQALSAQPPAIDMGDYAASWREVVQVFAPKRPRLETPPVAEVQRERPDALAAPGTPSPGDAWAEFNHNVAGLVVVAIALLACAARCNVPLARHWPLGFVALAVFLLFRNDPEAWPLGHEGFWTSLRDGGILQHRLAVLLASALGILEWRARIAQPPQGRLPFVFPLLSFVGGVLLLTHSHSAFEVKSDYLIEISHTGMGLLALLVAGGRLLELRLAPAGGRLAGVGSLVAMLLIGAILVFYREPDVSATRAVAAVAHVADVATAR